jgi:hypothetical protein
VHHCRRVDHRRDVRLQGWRHPSPRILRRVLLRIGFRGDGNGLSLAQRDGDQRRGGSSPSGGGWQRRPCVVTLLPLDACDGAHHAHVSPVSDNNRPWRAVRGEWATCSRRECSRRELGGKGRHSGNSWAMHSQPRVSDTNTAPATVQRGKSAQLKPVSSPPSRPLSPSPSPSNRSQSCGINAHPRSQ